MSSPTSHIRSRALKSIVEAQADEVCSEYQPRSNFDQGGASAIYADTLTDLKSDKGEQFEHKNI
jgi:hypothetical protein